MIRKLLICIPILFLCFSCNTDELKATVPAYLHIDAIDVNSDFNTEGTASDKITTAWIIVDDVIQGTYELPCDFPIIETGNRKIEVLAGMNLNGIASLRTVYPFYASYVENINLVPEVTHYLNSTEDSIPTFAYEGGNNINTLEDFEGIGLKFEETNSSDTAMFKTTDVSEVFHHKNEPVGGSGKVYLKPFQKFETSTIASFDLPKFGADVYLEINYKSDIPFTVGVFANEFNQTTQAPVVTVNPSDEWNKIYINLVTEVSGYPNALDFEIFIGSLNNSSSDRTIFLDNIKLVY